MSCKYWWDILQFLLTRIVRIIYAKNCENISKFIDGTAKILSVAFFPDTVYIIVNYNVLHTYMWCLSIIA